MVLTRDKEIWGMALWVEKHHEEGGHEFIQERIEALEAAGQTGGVKLWKQVAQRYAELRQIPVPIHGQADLLIN